MRAGRPREFCVEDALDRAMTVFWRNGYEGACMSELTAAMGINSPSLYACFGNKEGLFRAVLERYDERRKSFMDYVMAAPDVGEMAERFLHGVADFAADTSGGKNPPGCLLLQSGLAGGDSQIPDELARHRAEKEKALRQRLERARKSGDLPKAANPAALARYLLAVSNGICVQAASGVSAKDLHEVASMALMGWPGVVKAVKSRAAVKGNAATADA
jgi:AcrR family transcriptional regulator